MKNFFDRIDREFAEGEVEQAVVEIAKKSVQLNSRRWYELALSCIDLTTLNSSR